MRVEMSTHPAEHMDETIEFCTLVIEQAITFLDNLSTLDSSGSKLSTKEVFEKKSEILPNSVIGRHLRHVEGRITRVLDAMECPNSETLSYEGGKRMDNLTPPISTFQSTFQALRKRLISLPDSKFANPILIRRGSDVIESTALREVYAAAFHAIHHFAIIGALLREMMGPETAEKYIPRKFGFKPKTCERSRL